MLRFCRGCLRLSGWFPLWILLGCLWAWYQPSAWLWFQPWITGALSVIMLGMGLTLRFADFVEVVRRPKIIVFGVTAQFTIMPLAALAANACFSLDRELALGLILVACCPGGTASNVICYLARANVALSVLLTMCSTFVAVAMTPLLTKWLAGQLLPVDAWGLFRSMLVVVLVPLLIGLLLNSLIDRMKNKTVIKDLVGALGPLLSVILIVLVVGSIFAAGKSAIGRAGWTLFAAVFTLHAVGFGVGYFISYLSGCKAVDCRTISVEVGMQNSGLGASLAKQHFAALPLAPIPAAISAVFHCLIGSALGWWWNRASARKLRGSDQ